MTLRNALLATAAVVAMSPSLAFAQPISGPYVGIAGGVNILQDSDVTVQNVGRGEAEFDTGWAGFLTLGWGFGNGFRVELEGGYRSNELGALTGPVTAVTGRATGGTQTQWSGMLNALYDMNLGISWLYPYIGVGVGYAQVNWDDVRTANGQRIDGNSGQFAYQGIVGVSVPVGVQGLSLTADYRYFATLDPEFTLAGTNNKVDSENRNHTFTIGLRYAFGGPALPPVLAPAVAAPAPARTYLVFFDFARANLTDRARGTIREAATASRSQQVTRLEVSGHADRVGSDATNMALSRRRADTVAAELVRNGVQRNQIVVNAFGESRPLVPTADNVREAQNRRVEIVLR